MEVFKTRVGELGTNIKNWFYELFYGTEKTVQTPAGNKTVGQAGLFDRMASAFESFWESDMMTSLKDTVTGYFKDLIQLMSDTFVNSWFARTLLGIDREEVAARQAVSGTMTQTAGENIGTVLDNFIQQNEGSLISGKLAEDLKSGLSSEQVNTLLKGIEENQGSFLRALRPEGTEFRVELQRLTSKAEEGTATAAELEMLKKSYEIFTNAGYNTRAIGTLGTTGLKFEPKDTVAQLHRGERVLSPEETAKYNSTSSQTMSNEKLDQLNNTMMKVAGLLDSALGVQTRTMKNVKSLGFDYYRGSPA
jgi:hypothetical protein